MYAVVDQLPRLGKRELICLLLFTCNYVVSVRRGFLFLWVLQMGYVILLWHSLSLPYNNFVLDIYLRYTIPSIRGSLHLQQMSVLFDNRYECRAFLAVSTHYTQI